MNIRTLVHYNWIQRQLTAIGPNQTQTLTPSHQSQIKQMVTLLNRKIDTIHNATRLRQIRSVTHRLQKTGHLGPVIIDSEINHLIPELTILTRLR